MRHFLSTVTHFKLIPAALLSVGLYNSSLAPALSQEQNNEIESKQLRLQQFRQANQDKLIKINKEQIKWHCK